MDSKERVLTAEKSLDILSFCQRIIRRSLAPGGNIRKVVLLNEIIHFTAVHEVKDLDDPRKNARYLRDLVAALCDFHYQGQFYIPSSWQIFGKTIN